MGRRQEKMINIEEHKKGKLQSGNFYIFTRKEFRQIGASQFKEGDILRVSKYYVHIAYGNYDTPALCSWIEDENWKALDCTPGIETPYYIDDFKKR